MSRKLAESFHGRASQKQEEAQFHLQNYNYAESVSASIESIEFNTKAIFLFLGVNYQKSHEFKEEQLSIIIKKIPKKAQHYDFARLLLLTRFWSQFYIMAKYGSEKAGIGADKLFTEKEAKLAIEHAEECFIFARVVRNTT